MGASALQSGHQCAQKNSSTGRPFVSGIGGPRRSLALSAGAGWGGVGYRIFNKTPMLTGQPVTFAYLVDERREVERLLAQVIDDDLALVECFQNRDCMCFVEPACVLRKTLHQALEAFLKTLDGYTIADLLKPGRNLARLPALPQPGDRL